MIAGRIAPIDAAGAFPRTGSMMAFMSGEEPRHTIAACDAVERFQEALPPQLRIIAPVPVHIQMFWLVSAIIFFGCLMARGMIVPIPLFGPVLHRRTYLLHSVLLI